MLAGIYIARQFNYIQSIEIPYDSHGLRDQINEEFYDSITNPNFSIDPIILLELHSTQSMPFNEKEIQMLEIKFTHKYYSGSKKVYNDEAKSSFLIDPTNKQNCSICVIEFQNEDLSINLPNCGHTFHWQCIKPWLFQKPKCPVCRSNIRVGMIKA